MKLVENLLRIRENLEEENRFLTQENTCLKTANTELKNLFNSMTSENNQKLSQILELIKQDKKNKEDALLLNTLLTIDLDTAKYLLEQLRKPK